MDGTEITTWLLEEGRKLPGMTTLVEALAMKLNTVGLQVDRMSSSHETLHPEVAAFAYYWERDVEDVRILEIDFELQSSNAYLMSPVRVIYDGGHRVRCRLEGDDPELEYNFLEGLRDDGYTDYAVLAIPMMDGRQSPFTMATKRAGGFTDHDIAEVEKFLPTYGLLKEIHAGRSLASSLLDVYLGHGTGARVLAGAVRRGTASRYRAALLFCDLRGFTALTERLPRNFIIHVLNDYFDAVGRAIEAHEGEILKFIGDAALVIFPVGEGTDGEACDRALAAVNDLMANMAELNARRESEDKPALGIGVGLHVGEVMYGNIGTHNRLDFTVIGRAVNRAARLEQLAASLGRELLVSAEFAEACSTRCEPAGSHALKGIEGLTDAFCPV